jgi:hypothetical protein
MRRRLIYPLCSLLLITLSCESYREEVREDLLRAGVEMGVVIPPDINPPPYVVDSFTGTKAGRVSGNLVGLFSQATAVPELLVSQIMSGRETAGAYDYQAAEGVRIIIEDVFLQPRVVTPGDYLDINIKYALLSPAHDNWTEITEIRELFFNDELVGKPEAHVSLADGTYTTTVRIRLPAHVPAGQYQLVATVQTDYALDAEELRFVVFGGARRTAELE